MGPPPLPLLPPLLPLLHPLLPLLPLLLSSTPSATPEPTLLISNHSLSQDTHSLYHNSSTYFPRYTQQTYPSIILTLISTVSPFPLYNGTIIALTQSFGTLSSETHTLHTLVSHSNTASPPHFNISLVIPSTPGDLPFFNFFTAFPTSSTPTSNTPFASSFILSPTFH